MVSVAAVEPSTDTSKLPFSGAFEVISTRARWSSPGAAPPAAVGRYFTVTCCVVPTGTVIRSVESAKCCGATPPSAMSTMHSAWPVFSTPKVSSVSESRQRVPSARAPVLTRILQ